MGTDGGLYGVDGADDAGLGLLVPALLLAAVISIIYVIHTAPLLLAELLLDGAIVTAAARRLRRVEQRDWLTSAPRRTLLPFAVLLVTLVAFGFLAQSGDPEARSIGDLVSG